jgi:endonuclease V-like protein UPF0215 family
MHGGLSFQPNIDALNRAVAAQFPEHWERLKAMSEVGDPARCQRQELLAHGTNPGVAAGTVQRVIEGARAGRREGLVV